VSAAVAKLIASDDRFRSIPVVVRGGVVIIHTRNADDEAVEALSHALRRVKGIREIEQSSK
jgi:hypothetical protein